MSEQKKKTSLTQEGIMKMLEKLYNQSITGIPKISPPIEQLANNYLKKGKSKKASAKTFIKYQVTKCTTSGFITGIGGFITLPIAIPANIGSILYVQMRMIACLAYMGGYNLEDDEVQTLVYACLAGIAVDGIVKQTGIKFGTKMATSALKKIPGKTLTKINQKVGFKLFTKFGEKGLINLHKMIPFVGGVVGGAFDLIETKAIAGRAYKMFILNDFSSPEKNPNKDEKVITTEDYEILDNKNATNADS